VLPTYAGPELMTRACLEQWRSLGADVVESYGLSDVSLHRNIAFGLAMRFLNEDPKGAGKTVVLLLDSDMVASPQTVDVICQMTFYGNAIAAGYCKRGAPHELAYEFRGAMTTVLGLPCCEVRGGLGFLALQVAAFRQLCELQPTYQVGDAMPFPSVCSSGVVEGEWQSDDFSFCAKLELICKLLLAPIPVGHISKVALQPSPHATFLNRDG
jgi:hypothetical protein